MNALRVHGGGAVSRRISLRVGGRPAMLYRGEDASDEEVKLVGREYDVYDNSLKSSKADKGRGCCFGIVSRAPGGCRILGLTMLCDSGRFAMRSLDFWQERSRQALTKRNLGKHSNYTCTAR